MNAPPADAQIPHDPHWAEFEKQQEQMREKLLKGKVVKVTKTERVS